MLWNDIVLGLNSDPPTRNVILNQYHNNVMSESLVISKWPYYYLYPLEQYKDQARKNMFQSSFAIRGRIGNMGETKK